MCDGPLPTLQIFRAGIKEAQSTEGGRMVKIPTNRRPRLREDDDWQWSLMPTDAPENGNNYMPDCLECADRRDCQATG